MRWAISSRRARWRGRWSSKGCTDAARLWRGTGRRSRGGSDRRGRRKSPAQRVHDGHLTASLNDAASDLRATQLRPWRHVDASALRGMLIKESGGARPSARGHPMLAAVIVVKPRCVLRWSSQPASTYFTSSGQGRYSGIGEAFMQLSCMTARAGVEAGEVRRAASGFIGWLAASPHSRCPDGVWKPSRRPRRAV